MIRYNYQRTIPQTLAIGITGYRSSLCGAIKRFQRHRKRENNILSLKEQCARRIALIKNEQLKYFITAYIPPHLYEYVTNDIFTLHRQEFQSNYPEDFYLCEDCSLGPQDKSPMKCKCPRMKNAINKLNKYFFQQRMNNNNSNGGGNQPVRKKLKLIYKISTEQPNDFDEYNDETLYFLYILSCEYDDEVETYNTEVESIEIYRCIDNQVTIENKLLFVDILRFFDGFHTEQEQPRLIL